MQVSKKIEEQRPDVLNGGLVLKADPYSIEPDSGTVTYLVLVERQHPGIGETEYDYVVATYNRNTAPGWCWGSYFSEQQRAEDVYRSKLADKQASFNLQHLALS